MKNNGILCHGRHLEAINWELHQWGDSENGLLGQIAKTCLLTQKHNPSVVVFGTGASEKDGIKEADYTIRYMMDNFENLKDFSQFEGVDLIKLQNTMNKISVAETTSKDTYTEIKAAGKIFSNKGVGTLYIVSNPDHILRCGQLSHQIYQEGDISFLDEFLLAPSDVGYNGTKYLTSKVIEMPHRGDDKSPNLSGVIGNYFRLPLERKIEFYKLVKNFLES